MLTRNHVFTLLVLVAAVAAVSFNVPLASSQGLAIIAAAVEDELPIDAPDSALWQETTAVEIPLSAQIVARPISRETNVKEIVARALHNGEEIALMLEWADPTRNDSTLEVDSYRDSVAVQFPLVDDQPFFCMGQQGGDVVIWHWKADWQAEMFAQQNMRDTFPNMHVDEYPFTEMDDDDDVLLASYTDPTYLTAQAAGNLRAMTPRSTSVENLLAGGFSTLTSLSQDLQTVQGHGEWNDGTWRVIFTRSLAVAEDEGISLQPERVYSIAFAAWDGENQERGARKSTSQWVSLELAPAVMAAAPAVEAAAATPDGPFQMPLWALIFLLLIASMVVAAALIYYRLGSTGAT
jgi:hypothetical protein